MVLQSFGGSRAPLGISRGTLGGLLGALWGLLGASTSTTEGFQIPLATLLVLVCSLLAVSFRSFFDVVFYLLSVPLGVDFDLPSRPSDPQKPSFP